MLHLALVRHLARVAQDVECREQDDERPREREQSQGDHQVSERSPGEPPANAVRDVAGRVADDQPYDTCTEHGATEQHHPVAVALGDGLADGVVLARALSFADQQERWYGGDGD